MHSCGQRLAQNQSAKRFVDGTPEVWPFSTVIRESPVSQPRTDSSSPGSPGFHDPHQARIQLHHSVCSLNADFDGDQMAVHVPLSAKPWLRPSRSFSPQTICLSPASGDRFVAP